MTSWCPFLSIWPSSVAGLNDGVLLTQWYPGGDSLAYLHGDATIELGYSVVAFVDGHTEMPHIWETKTFSQDPFGFQPRRRDLSSDE